MKRLGIWMTDGKYPIELCELDEAENVPCAYLIKYNDIDHKMINAIEPQEKLYWIAAAVNISENNIA